MYLTKENGRIWTLNPNLLLILGSFHYQHITFFKSLLRDLQTQSHGFFCWTMGRHPKRSWAIKNESGADEECHSRASAGSSSLPCALSSWPPSTTPGTDVWPWEDVLQQRDHSQSVQTEVNVNSPVNAEDKTTLKPTWETLPSSDEKAAEITNICHGDADQAWEEWVPLPYRLDGPGT